MRGPASRRPSRCVGGRLAGPTLAASALLLLAAGCAPLPGGGGPGVGPDEGAVPPGFGTLRQEQLTLTLRSGDLQMKATPLEEWMIRLAAPDTYDRLSELAAAHRPALVRETGVPNPVLFLVSFFSDEPATRYEPEDVRILDRGIRHRPVGIRPVTPGWGTQRLTQRETRLAIYAFAPSVTLDMGMVLEYGDVRSHQWDAILQTLEAEHARARARASSSGGAPQTSGSMSYRLIFR